MKIFVSLPMHGMDPLQVQERQEELRQYAEDFLRNNYNVPDDFSLELIKTNVYYEKASTKKTPRVYMLGKSISLLGDADLVIFDTTWSASSGCRIEMNTCIEYGIPRLAIDAFGKRLVQTGPWNNFPFNDKEPLVDNRIPRNSGRYPYIKKES